MKKNILVVVAHPDDEVLGCGGTIARLAKQGQPVFTLILSGGVASRYAQISSGRISKELSRLKKQSLRANEILGVSRAIFKDHPDNKFDSVPLLSIIKDVESAIREIKPVIIFTHNPGDLNVDHAITYKAVITAARPVLGCSVQEIYSFEVLSSTEWNYPEQFFPDTFYDITDFLAIKLRAMKAYRDELKQPPHSRSLQGIQVNAQRRGMQAGVKYAEAFKAIRVVK